MTSFVWAILLLVVGMSLAVIEVFIPSGGVLGTMCLLSLVASIALAFQSGPWTGVGFLAMGVLAVPTLVATALHFWPKTAIGKRLLLQTPDPDEVMPDSDRRRKLKTFVGQTGHAVSPMLPGGVVEIEGEQVDAVSEGLAIETGQRVKVVEVRGTRVVVRPATDAPPAPEVADALSESIDKLGEDPFET